MHSLITYVFRLMPYDLSVVRFTSEFTSYGLCLTYFLLLLTFSYVLL